MNIKNIEFKYLLDPQKPFWLLLLFFITGAVVITREILTPKAFGNVKIEEEKIDITTLIPPGQVLVPLELSNHDRVDSLLGEYGYVDLYQIKNEELEHSKKLVAGHIKILRAPLNPQEFAVLIDDSNEALIHHLTQQLFAVVKNPTTDQKRISKKIIPKPSSQTIYGDQL